MPEADLIIRGGTVVNADRLEVADLAVGGGRILGVDTEVSRARVVDARGLHVLPGGIDSHVHFNDPGRTDWETLATGSRALAAGGYTAFVDMPLNNLPVTVDAVSLATKMAVAERSAAVDFGFWGGLVPGHLNDLEELVAAGVFGCKAFMCPSGIPEFPECDADVLREGMCRLARLGSIAVVHAESPAVLAAAAAGVRGRSARDFARSRPPGAETAAIELAVQLAGETGCRLHVVHVSTAEGFALIEAAQARGVDVSGETCPHYLLLDEGDLNPLGGLGKCAPPLRSHEERQRLWQLFLARRIPIVVSDHSPSTRELKEGRDYFDLWGGISGCQTTRQLLLAQGAPPALVAATTATNIARRFGIPGKGAIAPGGDADLWLVDLTHEEALDARDLLYRNPFSAWEGHPVRGRTVMTLVRGEVAYDARQGPAARPVGRFMRPAAGPLSQPPA